MSCFRFGIHELDLARYELRREGSAIKVDPKAFDALRVLAERADSLVSKEELRQLLWPRENVVEGAVHSTIARARRALRQRGSDDGPIATVHGRGYRFVQPIEHIGSPLGSKSHGARDSDLPSTPQPFVGRERALAVLCERLSMPEPGLYWLDGDAGMGKTRLCEELSSAASEQGVRALWGRCLESAGKPAFWPFRRLHQALESSVPGALEALPAPWRTELARLRPDPDAETLDPSMASWAGGRFQLYEAVAAMLREGAKRGVRLYILDDIHWADEPSLSLLEFLAGELHGAPWMLVVTFRSGVQPRSAPVARTRARVRRQPGAHTLRLDALNAADVCTWLQKAGQVPDNQAVADVLCDKTGGNPLFISESMRMLPTSAQPLTVSHIQALGVPDGVGDLLRERLHALPAPTRHVLFQASIAGRELDTAVLARALEKDLHAVHEALEPALTARIVRRLPTGALQFDHDLWQAALSAQHGERERAQAHLAVARALESDPLGAEQHADALAHHYLAAVPSAPMDATIRWCRLAAERASASHGYEDAARVLEQALNALRFADRVDAETVTQLRLARGRALERAGRTQEAWVQLSQVVEAARAQGDVSRMARAALGLRTLHVLAVPHEKQRRVLSEVEHQLPEDARMLRARVSARLAMQAPQAMCMEERRKRADRAMQLLGDCRDEATLLDVHAAHLQSLQGPHQQEELHAACEASLALAQAQGLDSLKAEVYAAQYLAHLSSCNRASALRAWENFGQIAEQLRHPIYRWHHQRFLAYDRMYEGHFADALASFRALHKTGKHLHPWLSHLFHRTEVHMLARYRNDSSRHAHVPVTDFLKEYRWTGSNLCAAIAVFYAETAQVREATEAFERLAAEDFTDIPMAIEYVATLSNLSEVAARLDDRARGARLYELLEPYARYNTVTALGLYDGVGAFYLGLLSRLLGEPERAKRWFTCALELHEGMHNRPYMARTRVELATLAAEVGDLHDARHWADGARPAISALSLEPLALRLKRLSLA